MHHDVCNTLVLLFPDHVVGVRMKHAVQPGARQKWVRRNDIIVNSDNTQEVIDIYHSDASKGAKIIAYKYHGRKNQLWKFVPCD